jgi:ribosomal protein S18 acetylase RimI-like enzyme
MTIDEEQPLRADITKMQEGDLDQVISLSSSSTELQTGTNSPQFYSRETLSRWIQSLNGILLVAKVNDVFAGFSITAYNPDSRDGYIHTVDVAPQFQSKGIGSQLIDKTLVELERTDCNHVYCLIQPTNESSKALFSKFGFEVGEAFNYVERELPRNA